MSPGLVTSPQNAGLKEEFSAPLSYEAMEHLGRYSRRKKWKENVRYMFLCRPTFFIRTNLVCFIPVPVRMHQTKTTAAAAAALRKI